MILNKQNIHPSILLLLCALVMRAAAYTEAQSPPRKLVSSPSVTEMFVFGWMDVLVQFRFDVFLNRTRIGWMFLCFLLVWMNLILINRVIFLFFASVKLCAVGWTQAEFIFSCYLYTRVYSAVSCTANTNKVKNSTQREHTNISLCLSICSADCKGTRMSRTAKNINLIRKCIEGEYKWTQ